jgi:hypothetical protein
MFLVEALGLLGLKDLSITPEDLKKKYHALMKKNHPDISTEDEETAKRRTQELVSAIKVIKKEMEERAEKARLAAEISKGKMGTTKENRPEKPAETVVGTDPATNYNVTYGAWNNPEEWNWGKEIFEEARKEVSLEINLAALIDILDNKELELDIESEPTKVDFEFCIKNRTKLVLQITTDTGVNRQNHRIVKRWQGERAVSLDLEVETKAENRDLDIDIYHSKRFKVDFIGDFVTRVKVHPKLELVIRVTRKDC